MKIGTGAKIAPSGFVVVYKGESDGRIIIEPMTRKRIQQLAKRRHSGDYAILKGTVIKRLDQNFDVERLKSGSPQ